MEISPRLWNTLHARPEVDFSDLFIWALLSGHFNTGKDGAGMAQL